MPEPSPLPSLSRSGPGARVSTAAAADACARLGAPLRLAPPAIGPVLAGVRLGGPALPVRHVGSVDALLEAIDGASGGEVLVVDDGGLDTEACVGDLVVLEAREAGLAGVVVWGRHRDTAQLAGIGLPVFSRGACPAGPRADRQRPAAAGPVRIGHVAVAPGDLVLADDDGVLVVDHDQAGAVIAEAQRIQAVEAGQAQRLTAGISLREQLDFPGYLQRRRTTPSLTFRHHLAALGAAIEA